MKRMSFYGHPHLRASESYFGYAYTYNEISKHLRMCSVSDERLHIDLNSPKSNIQLHYGTPPGRFYPHQYKIQMTQWESTMVPPSWVDHARDYDEYWTANEFGLNAFIDAGVPESKLHIFEHGIDCSIWTPKPRAQHDVVRFLHIDSGSPRKRGGMAKDAFIAAFGGNMDYEITFKYSHQRLSDADWFDESILSTRGEWEKPNIRHIHENLTLEHLVSLFHFHDILIYPSEGEGFGLIPLQALATGMPVVSTSRWCSYEGLLRGNVIESHLGQSDIVENYTRYGDVVVPHFDSVVHLMRNVADSIDLQAKQFLGQVDGIRNKYDWLKLTQDAVNRLEQRVGLNMFNSYTGYLSDRKKRRVVA